MSEVFANFGKCDFLDVGNDIKSVCIDSKRAALSNQFSIRATGHDAFRAAQLRDKRTTSAHPGLPGLSIKPNHAGVAVKPVAKSDLELASLPCLEREIEVAARAIVINLKNDGSVGIHIAILSMYRHRQAANCQTLVRCLAFSIELRLSRQI